MFFFSLCNNESHAKKKQKQKNLNDDKLIIIEICLLNYVANKMFAQGGNECKINGKGE